MAEAPPSPESRLSLALTGHRESNPAFAANRQAVLTTLAALFDQVESAARESVDGLGQLVPVRLHALIADGADQAGFGLGQQRGWELVAPLPVGRNLNLAINAHPISIDDALALLAGGTAPHPECEAGAAAIRAWYGAAQLFELADHDEVLTGQFLESLANPTDRDAAHRAQAGISAQVALAGRVMIEQSDLMIAIWDGRSSNLVGGTGHTIAAALERGCPVVRIDPAAPSDWRVSELVCPRCASQGHQSPMVWRTARDPTIPGYFLGCSRFPECRYIDRS